MPKPTTAQTHTPGPMSLCRICGKPQTSYPNWLLSKGHAYHVGCIAEDYERAQNTIKRLYNASIVSGTFGPWSDYWTDEDRKWWDGEEEGRE